MMQIKCHILVDVRISLNQHRVVFRCIITRANSHLRNNNKLDKFHYSSRSQITSSEVKTVIGPSPFPLDSPLIMDSIIKSFLKSYNQWEK